jgi:hypothetical protein
MNQLINILVTVTRIEMMVAIGLGVTFTRRSAAGAGGNDLEQAVLRL